MGRDSTAIIPSRPLRDFNPRAPRGARRQSRAQSLQLSSFQSTRPAWGATPPGLEPGDVGRISIHAPRVGRDPRQPAARADIRISIHAPRVGRDKVGFDIKHERLYFNPRAPRGARPRSTGRSTRWSTYFNPRAPRGARRRPCLTLPMPDYFNPRAPRGARLWKFTFPRFSVSFQSTRPAWGATTSYQNNFLEFSISIHAPRVGRDGKVVWFLVHRRISIHAPRVGRDLGCAPPVSAMPTFQSTRPAWGATTGMLAEFVRGLQFQSTRPAWGATTISSMLTFEKDISIHAPRVGRDAAPSHRAFRHSFISIHAPRVGRDGGDRAERARNA